jgi:hypothetical protein
MASILDVPGALDIDKVDVVAWGGVGAALERKYQPLVLKVAFGLVFEQPFEDDFQGPGFVFPKAWRKDF